MISINEFLSPLRKDNKFMQMINNNKLKSQMRRLSKSHKGWKYFCYLLETGNTGVTATSRFDLSYDPDNIAALCLKLGFKTDQDLYSFVENINKINTDGLIDCHSPTLDIPEYYLRKETYQNVIDVIKKEAPCEKNLKIFEQLDNDYYLINSKIISYILKQCPIDKYKFQAESRDCDDYAFMLRAFLSECGYGNLAIPYVTVNVYEEDEFVFAHGINLICGFNDKSDLELSFLEPQSDTIWGVDEKMTWGLNKYDVRIRQILL